MPCFGTSSRTKSNAIVVAEQIGAEVRVIDIGKSVYQHFDDIGHAHDDYSIAFENAQARERTQVLMDIANKLNGLDVGTEDLSEFIDGWCTYNGDHTSMYDVNMGLTKTQVRANVRYIAGKTEDRVLKAALYDVLDCPVTPGCRRYMTIRSSRRARIPSALTAFRTSSRIRFSSAATAQPRPCVWRSSRIITSLRTRSLSAG